MAGLGGTVAEPEGLATSLWMGDGSSANARNHSYSSLVDHPSSVDSQLQLLLAEHCYR